VRASTNNDLLVSVNDAKHEFIMILLRCVFVSREGTEIIDAFEYDQVTHACLREDVPVKARQRVWAKTIGQQMIASDTLVKDARGARCGIPLQPLRQYVGPTVITIGGRRMSVGDGISQRNN
jgi:hypothetical protein